MLDFTNYRNRIRYILAYYCPLRNEVSCGIIQIQKKFKNEVRPVQTYISRSEAETERIGEQFAKDLPDGSVVAMYGGLGAGKTAFVRGMAKGMGLSCRVSSPTFTIVNEYIGERELIHFDMYRLDSADELFDIGWEDYLRRGAVCAVEWSEKVEDAFFGDEIVLRIEKLGDSVRKITIEEGNAKC